MEKLRYNVLITTNPGTRRATETFEMFEDEGSARAFIAANAKAGNAVHLSRMAVRLTDAKWDIWRAFPGGEYTVLI